MTTGPLLAWHFLADDGMTRYEPRVKVEVGQTLTVNRPLWLCAVGLHASLQPLDALRYAPGALCCRVRLEGEILSDTDKLCAARRTVLAMADATPLLHEFGCWCAEQALHRTQTAGGTTDARSWAAVEAKRRWLRGEIDRNTLSVATAAAWDATRADPRWDAAALAAWKAAWEEAWEGARMAAGRADWKARDWAAENAELERRLTELLQTA